MGKALEPYGSGSEDWGGRVPPWAYPPPDRPEYLNLRPSHNVENRLEHGFNKAMVGPRAVALAFLWFTANVYAFMCGCLIAVLLVALLMAR